LTGKRLEAPHRRREQGPRILEKTAVMAYAAAVWVVAHVPERLARWVIGTGSQAGYLLWPTKRAWSNANFEDVSWPSVMTINAFCPLTPRKL
jgi:hypothetical protein